MAFSTKKIRFYLSWFFLAIVFGIISFRLRIGSYPFDSNSTNFFLQAFEFLFYLGSLIIGIITGVIAFILYVVINHKILKKLTFSSFNLFLIRVTTLILLIVIVSIIHDVLEYKLDWI